VLTNHKHMYQISHTQHQFLLIYFRSCTLCCICRLETDS